MPVTLEIRTWTHSMTTTSTPATQAIPFQVDKTRLSNHHAAASKVMAQEITICTSTPNTNSYKTACIKQKKCATTCLACRKEKMQENRSKMWNI